MDDNPDSALVAVKLAEGCQAEPSAPSERAVDPREKRDVFLLCKGTNGVRNKRCSAENYCEIVWWSFLPRVAWMRITNRAELPFIATHRQLVVFLLKVAMTLALSGFVAGRWYKERLSVVMTRD